MAVPRFEPRLSGDGVADSLHERKVVMTDPQGTPVAYGWIAGPDHWLQLPGTAVFRFRRSADSMAVFPEADVPEEAVMDAYRSVALPLALQVSGFEALHGSATSFEGGVVAFCAPSETGKTTVAFALSKRGHPLWADDAVVFEAPASGAVRSYRIPFTPNLRAQTRMLFGLQEREERASIAPDVPEGEALPLRAVVLLVRADSGGPRTEIRRLGVQRALTATIAQGHRFYLGDPEHKRRMLQNYLRLVSSVPVLQVRFVPGLERLSLLLDDLEEALASAMPGLGTPPRSYDSARISS